MIRWQSAKANSGHRRSATAPLLPRTEDRRFTTAKATVSPTPTDATRTRLRHPKKITPPPVRTQTVQAVRPSATRPDEALRDGRVLRGPQRERHEPDYLILVSVVALVAIGILMIFSSSGIRVALDGQGDLFWAAAPQIIWSGIGIAVMLFMSKLDYRFLRLVSRGMFLLAFLLLIVVLLPSIGPFHPIEVGNSARWLQLGPLPPVHPAEFAKLALIIYLAHWLAARGGDVGSLFRGLVPFLVIAGPVILLVAIEPDLGTTGVIALTAMTMLFVAGASLWQLALLLPMGVGAVALYVMTVPYQMARVRAFLDPWQYAASDGYQTVHGLMALAMGGVLGNGLGQSSQPGALPLPNAANDFIFAVIGQEFGLVGGVVVVGLYLFLAYRGVRVALAAPDTFGGLLAVGITACLTFQAFINIGVVVNLLPITGITLPFVSSGLSSLVVSFAAVEILLSVSRETVQKGTAFDADPDRSRRHGRARLPRPGRPALAG